MQQIFSLTHISNYFKRLPDVFAITQCITASVVHGNVKLNQFVALPPLYNNKSSTDEGYGRKKQY